MDQNTTVDAYEEHVKRVRARVAAEEEARLDESVTCNATLDRIVMEGLRGLIADNIGRYGLNAQRLLSRADIQLADALRDTVSP